ncbi:MAG: hypothetical protein ACTSRP_16920 [Candidatus Helarchaeota archaeon]
MDEQDIFYSNKLYKELKNRPSNSITYKNLKFYKNKVKDVLNLGLGEFRRGLDRCKSEINQAKYPLLKRLENSLMRTHSY